MLYGLPDSGRNFERYFDKFLRESCGAVPMVVDRSVYKIQTKKGEIIYCAVFVDDAVFWGTSDGALSAFRNAIRMHFGEYKTREQGIRFHGSSRVLNQGFPRRNKLDAYVDANLGGDAFNERSRSCYVIQLNGGMVSMKIMKQPVVARSTGHAEMRALAMLAQQLQ